MIIVTFFEAASVATFIPVLEYLQAGNMQEIGSNPSKIWVLYQIIFDKLGLAINILTLSVSIVILVTLRQTFNYISTVKINTLKHRIGRDIAIKCFSGIFNSKPLYIQNFQYHHYLYYEHLLILQTFHEHDCSQNLQLKCLGT